jgi:hypothetical protein
MRMLEKWAKTTGDGSYVRKRVKPKKKRRAKGACEILFSSPGLTLTGPPIIVHGMEEEPDGVPDAEEEEELAEGQPEDDVIEETMFTFESFELVRGRARGVVHAHRTVSLTRTLEIRKLGHHTVATDLRWASQRVHVIRGDETRGQPAAPAGGARQGGRTILPSESITSSMRFVRGGRCMHVF